MLILTNNYSPFIGSYKCVCGEIYFNSSKNKTMYVDIEQLLSDEFSFDHALLSNRENDLHFEKLNGQLILTVSTDKNCILCDELSVEELSELLSDKLELSESDLAKFIMRANEGLELLENKNIIIALSDKVRNPETRKLIQEFNQSCTGTKAVNYAKVYNKRDTKQITCTDIIYFTLPKAKTLSNFKHENSRDAIALQNNCINLRTVIDDSFKPYRKYSTIIKELPTYGNYKTLISMNPELENILLGKRVNDYLPLQENEQDLYDSLNDYLDEYVKNYCAENPQFKFNQIIEKPYLNDTSLDIILESIINIIIDKNWSHSFNYDLNTQMSNDFVSMADGPIVDNDTESDYYTETTTQDNLASAGSKYSINLENNSEALDEITFKLDSRDPSQVEAKNIITFLSGFKMLIEKNKGNLYSWSEIIIKLLRWGNRKPTMMTLNFPKSNSLDFFALNLIGFESLTTTENYEEKVSQGASTYITGLVMTSQGVPTYINYNPETLNSLGLTRFQNIKPTILGVVTYQMGVVDRLCFMDLFTLMSRIDSIENISLNNEEITIEDLDTANIIYLNNVISNPSKIDNNNQYYIDNCEDVRKKDLYSSNMFAYFRAISSEESFEKLKSDKEIKTYPLLLKMSKLFIPYLTENDNFFESTDKLEYVNQALTTFHDMYVEYMNSHSKEELTTSLFETSENTFNPEYMPITNNIVFALEYTNNTSLNTHSYYKILRILPKEEIKPEYLKDAIPVKSIYRILQIVLDKENYKDVYISSEIKKTLINILNATVAKNWPTKINSDADLLNVYNKLSAQMKKQ